MRYHRNFYVFMAEVFKHCIELARVLPEDLPWYDYWKDFENKVEPKQSALHALRRAGWKGEEGE